MASLIPWLLYTGSVHQMGSALALIMAGRILTAASATATRISLILTGMPSLILWLLYRG
jgi:hypothetical protein